MPVYEESLSIAADSDSIFAFASEAANMPKYLNTVKEAWADGPKEGNRGRIGMRGEANGHPYEGEGWIEYEAGSNRITWGSDGQNDSTGSLDVSGTGTDSTVTVALNFAPKPDQDAEFEKQMGSRDAAIRDGLRTSLQSLKNHIEGTGGKVDNGAETGG